MTDVNPEAPAFPAEWIATARWLASRFLNGKVCSTFTTLEKDFLDHAFRDESSDLNSMLSYFQHRGLIGAEKPHFVGTETEGRRTDYAREILPAILDFVHENAEPVIPAAVAVGRHEKECTSRQVANFLGIEPTSLVKKSWPKAIRRGSRRGPAVYAWESLKPALQKQYPKEDWDKLGADL